MEQLQQRLKNCTYLDEVILGSRLRNVKKIKNQDKRQLTLQKIESALQEAEEKFTKRVEREIYIKYPEGLPVSQKADEILSAISDHQVVIVAGETGSGKTTQLPKICLAAGLGRKGMIGHTQPRRLAARTVSNRIAEELNSELGDIVGYQVRFTDQAGESTHLKLMTDGILLAEIKADPNLYRYDTIIIDEAHERSLNIDFLLGYLKRLLTKRSNLKVIITSATIDVERFSRHFNEAPIISVSGRNYPVEVKYRPSTLADESEADPLDLGMQVGAAIEEIEVDEKDRGWPIGDVLVFLPGEREIRHVAKSLRQQAFRDTEVLPLYARLSNEEQNRIFKSHRGRRIVLSTNVAETSITVPGIRYVVDSGSVRMSRYSYRSKIQRLPVEAISQASANQRMGRCGRVAEGICYRLYSEEDFLGRPEFTDPEILRTNLASVILKMIDAKLGEVKAFPFVDPPDTKQLNDGYKLLFELQAVDANRNITDLGKSMARLPVDPKLARMILESAKQGCLKEVLIICSALSIQDPRDRPNEKAASADQAHAQFKDKESDFATFVNIWNQFEEQRQALSSNQLRKFAKQNFLNFLRMQEWREIHRQLRILAKEIKLHENAEDASHAAVHKSLLSGLLSNIGLHDEKREYKATRGRRFTVFPGSALAKKQAKWLLSAEIVETQQVYARTNAKIDPEWIEPLAKHLVKKSWSEPHWSSKRAQVQAFEKVSLYGLEIVSKRKVNFGLIDQKLSREIFIRSGLVESSYASKAAEIKANQKLMAMLEQQEDRTRKRDVLIDDEGVFQLYDEIIPPDIVSGRHFESWYKSLPEQERRGLAFTQDQLVRSQAPTFDPSLFPDELENNGLRLPLEYHFNPGSERDGVSLKVPQSAIQQLSANNLEKLVPGLLREKCIQLVKNLPRTLRKYFVPIPDTVDAILPELESSGEPLLEDLSRLLKKRSGKEIPYELWQLDKLDPHLRFNIEVVDECGKVLQRQRDLNAFDLSKFKSDKSPETKKSKSSFQSVGSKDWAFGELAESIFVKEAGIEMKMFPSLEDHVSEVRSVLCTNQLNAERLLRKALARLLFFKLKDQIDLLPRVIDDHKSMGLYFAPTGRAQQLYDDFYMAAVANHFLSNSDLPRSKQHFETIYNEKRGEFVVATQKFAKVVIETLSKHHALKKLLKGKVNLALALPMGDLKQQLENLVYEGFLFNTPQEYLNALPRYLEAALVRHEKMSRQMGLERTYVPQLQVWWEQYSKRLAQFERQGIWDDELDAFRWMLEELRVSWYAQQLGTAYTISDKRLNKQWEKVRKS